MLKGRIADVLPMRKPETCDPTCTIAEVIEKLNKSNIGSVVILDGTKVAGIFTERDYIKKIAPQDLNDKEIQVKDYMTVDPQMLNENDDLQKAIVQMRMGDFRHYIVNDDEGNLKWVVSIKDILEFFIDKF